MGPPVRRADPIDPAAEELYGVPLGRFTAERKRLADELRAAGDRAHAARVAALARPTLPAWAVNQLWRRRRAAMEELFAAGQRMRAGDPAAWQEQRAALADLAAAAAEILRADRHAASPATLRRVTSTLQALSATGSFAPDPPGRLVADRDPPGFEVLTGDDPAVLARPARQAATTGRTRERIADKASRRETSERARAEAHAAIDRARAAARDKAERERTAEKARSRAASLGRTIERLEAEIGEMEEKLATRREALETARADRDAALREADAASGRRPRR